MPNVKLTEMCMYGHVGKETQTQEIERSYRFPKEVSRQSSSFGTTPWVPKIYNVIQWARENNLLLMVLQTAGASAWEPWFPLPVSHGTTQWAQIVCMRTVDCTQLKSPELGVQHLL